MADDAGDDTGDLKLPPKFISVHPLAAKKGSHYTCVICGSDGTFLCKLCRSCYCCREHLLLDDLACHAVLCERQAAIIEIKQLPLATRARPDTSQRLFALQDECRRIAYLESRRHVLEGHHELALPAAERSLTYAREVHGQNSIDLVPPLLALADVATLAGAKEALGYVSRAAFLIQEAHTHSRNQISPLLESKIKQNLYNLAKINQKAIDQFLISEKNARESKIGGNWSPTRGGHQNQEGSTQNILLNGRSPQRRSSEASNRGATIQVQSAQQSQNDVENKPNTPTSPNRQTNRTRTQEGVPGILGNTGTTKTLLQQAADLQLENSIRTEIFNASGGAYLAFLTSKYWSSSSKILVWEDRYQEALRSASIALYFATLSCGTSSLQTCLCIYQLAHLGQLSECFSEAQQIQAFLAAQAILKEALLQYYSPLVLQIDQLIQDRKLDFSFESEQLKLYVQDYNRAEQMRDEDRLSFRADIKEAVQRAVYSLQSLERKFGQNSWQYAECVVLVGVALQCTEDSGVVDWDQQGAPCCKQLMEFIDVKWAQALCYVYRILYGW